MPLVSIGAAQGGNVRVGLEDSLWAGPGQLARSNAEQVRKVRDVLRGLSLEPATPDEARELLQLKGAENVDFAAAAAAASDAEPQYESATA